MAGKHSRFTLILLALIAACVIILVVGLVIGQQQDQQVQLLKADYDHLHTQYLEVDKEIKELPQRQKELVTLNEELSQIDLNLMDYKYIPTYLREIEETARQTGNDLRTITPHALRPLDLQKSPLNTKHTAASNANAAPYQVQQITLDISGNYVSLISFLDALRRFPKIVYVRTINLSPHALEKGGIGVEAQVETYAIITPEQYQKSPDNLTAALKTGVQTDTADKNNAVVNRAAAALNAAGKANNDNGGGQQ